MLIIIFNLIIFKLQVPIPRWTTTSKCFGQIMKNFNFQKEPVEKLWLQIKATLFTFIENIMEMFPGSVIKERNINAELICTLLIIVFLSKLGHIIIHLSCLMNKLLIVIMEYNIEYFTILRYCFFLSLLLNIWIQFYINSYHAFYKIY